MRTLSINEWSNIHAGFVDGGPSENTISLSDISAVFQPSANTYTFKSVIRYGLVGVLWAFLLPR